MYEHPNRTGDYNRACIVRDQCQRRKAIRGKPGSTSLRFAHRVAASGLDRPASPKPEGLMCNARACDAPSKIRPDTVRWVTS